MWACAQTGSGKTAAFALPLLQKLATTRRERGRLVRALILAPTRELAAQIGESLRNYAQFLTEPLKTLVVYGGVSINPQMMALGGGADIIVATPGRLLDLIDHNAVSLSAVSVLVLDEADRLLELGFTAELTRILALLPARRQSLLFSATFPPSVEALAAGLLRNPLRLEIPAEPATTPDILQRAIEVDPLRRTQLLRHLVQENKWSRVLVFMATKYATEHVAEKLRKAGLAATAFHGELSQGARTQARVAAGGERGRDAGHRAAAGAPARRPAHRQRQPRLRAREWTRRHAAGGAIHPLPPHASNPQRAWHRHRPAAPTGRLR